MNLVQRSALFTAVLFLIGAGTATFLPTSPSGAMCGSWVNPEWTEEGTRSIVESAEKSYEFANGIGADQLSGDAAGIALGAAAAYRVCSDALSTRRTLALVLLGLALVIPAGILFIGAARKDPGDGTETA